MPNAETYLQYIVHEIHTLIVAAVDEDGLPVTAAIDMMDSDYNNLHFLTAKGKTGSLPSIANHMWDSRRNPAVLFWGYGILYL